MQRSSILVVSVLAGVLGCSTVPPPSLNGLQQIEGQIVRVDGDGYVIRDGHGRELRLQAIPSAHVDGNLTPGDAVMVRVGAPYRPNLRYVKAVHRFKDIETTYGEVVAKDSSRILVKDDRGREIALLLDEHSTGYGVAQRGDRIFAKTYRAPYEGEVQEFRDGAYIVRDINGREVRYEVRDAPQSPDPMERALPTERPAMRHDVPYARSLYLFTDPVSRQGTLLRREGGLYGVTGSEDLLLIIGQATVQDANVQPGEQVFIVVSPLPVIQASSIEKL